MIAVQVELWPLGYSEDRKIIAAMVIENCGLDDSGISYRYAAELHHTGDPALQISAGEQSTEIVGHDRRDTVWKLINRVLSAAIAKDGDRSATDGLSGDPADDSGDGGR
ncbi:hypothetical protein [Sphingomonas xinjiangensis]|uniref:Uncharacterized protein n=1 Tax=Sphingomonas xinjiangensis TaxID=643568 RepID=A0A840YNK7_9SPHN|nr:hypothetical protein [Sphingomonas xinjiangensis]MBB5711866.1 hypothetical protein [Sphingomonas xinjiangensis]